MIYKIVIKGLLYQNKRTFPGLNEYLSECGRHPQAGGKCKRLWTLTACDYIRYQHPRLRIVKPIIIHYRFYEPDRGRDKGNIFAFFDKCFEDALQKCEVIDNDGWKEIKNFTHEFYVDKKNPRVEIDIEEVET